MTYIESVLSLNKREESVKCLQITYTRNMIGRSMRNKGVKIRFIRNKLIMIKHNDLPFISESELQQSGPMM